MTTISMNGVGISDLAFPIDVQDAATRDYVDAMLDPRITAVGAVVQLIDSRHITVVGIADFDGGISGAFIPLDLYAANGMTFRTGLLTDILPGCTVGGNATAPQYRDEEGHFPSPISGHGLANSTFALRAGVATFSQLVTKVGMTGSNNGIQYLTAFNGTGQIIGQVKWTAANTSGFFGINTKGVPIAMIAFGNDDLWNGAAYSVSGPTTYSDTWIWGN